MNSRERMLAVLNGKMPDKIPFADFINEGVEAQLMKHYGVTSGDKFELAKVIGMDAIYFLDYCAPVFTKTPETKNQEGHITDGIIKTESDLDKMVLPNPHDPSFYDPAKKFMEKYGDSEMAIYSGMRSMFVYNVIFSMGIMDFSYALYDNLSLINKMIDIYAEWNIAVTENLQKIGIDFIMSYTDMAFNSGPFMPPEVFKEVFLPKMKLVANATTVPWAFHSDGNVGPVFDDLLTLGMGAINPIDPNCMDIVEYKKKYGDKVSLWGNVNLNTLGMGTEEEVEEEVKSLIKNIGKDGRYIFATANSIPDYCKIENVIAMIETFKKYRDYPIQL